MGDLGNPLHGHKANLTHVMGPGFVMCKNIGVAPLGEIWLRRRGETWEARQHVQVMMSQPADSKCDGQSPFRDDFCANYARGVGVSEKAAVDALVADRGQMADSLFA